MSEWGWFADTDPEAVPGWPWQPVLQYPGGIASLSVWFKTRKECEDWLKANVIGAPLDVGE